MRLEVNCQDRLGIAQDVLDILVEHEIDLRGIEIDELGKIFLNFPNIEFADFQHLMPKIRKIEGIEDVKTTPFMPLEREQYQLKALLQTLPDPVFSVDTKGKIIMINDAVVSSLEVPKNEIIGSVIQLGEHKINQRNWDKDTIEKNDFFCADKSSVLKWESYLNDIRKKGLSCGAIIEVIALFNKGSVLKPKTPKSIIPSSLPKFSGK